jgi:nicotinamidase/pyrazinamidase
VQNTFGADLAAGLDRRRIDKVIRKGMDRDTDSYSGFFDKGGLKSTGLAGLLLSQEIDTICVAGLATDYCVKRTVLDACKLGFEVAVVLEAIRGIELRPGDCEKALAEMTAAGAIVGHEADVYAGAK